MLDESVDIVPSVLEVAALLRARTKDSNSVEVGTFNDDTRPTSSQVLTLIDVAVTDIELRLGPWLTDELADAARSAAALRTACLIELSYFPEQIDSRRSPYPELVALLESKLEALRQAAKVPASTTRIEVPWVDFIPASPVPVAVTVGAKTA